jgi:hypothetical protein
LCTTLSSSRRATCPAHLILLDVITRTKLGEETTGKLQFVIVPVPFWRHCPHERHLSLQTIL